MSSSSIRTQNQGHDQEIAIREVSRVFDLIKKLQALLHQFKAINGDHKTMHMHELAQSLFGETLQTLNHALCIMKSSKTKMEIKQEIGILDGTGSPAYSGSPVSCDLDRRIANQKVKRRRVEDYSWTNITSMPYDDGYQWRKYGEKNISGSDFPRGYFRCTYKDGQNCEARKLVQQINNNDPPLFDVKYSNKHTCNSLKQNFTPSSSPPQEKPRISVENYNCINQLSKDQDCNQMLAQISMNHASVLNGGNLGEIISSEWDLNSMLMEFAGFKEDDCFLLPSLKSF